MQDSPFESNFQEGKGVRGSLEEILNILHENDVDENTLIQVTLPSILWFDTMQACAVAGGMLLEVSKTYDEDSEEFDQCVSGVERTQTIYNEVYDSLVRLAKQEVK